MTTDPSDEFDLLHLHSIGPYSLYLAERISWRRAVLINSHVTAEDFANSFRMSDKIAPYLARYLRFFYAKTDVLKRVGQRLRTSTNTSCTEPLSYGSLSPGGIAAPWAVFSQVVRPVTALRTYR